MTPTAWTSPVRLSADPTDTDTWNGLDVVSLGASSDLGTQLALWKAWNAPSTQHRLQSAYTRNGGRSWSAPLDLLAGGAPARSPRVALSRDGTTAVAVWLISYEGQDRVQGATLDLTAPSPQWSAPELLSDPSLASSPYTDCSGVAISDDGRKVALLYVSRDASSKNRAVLKRASRSDGAWSWSTATELSPGDADVGSADLAASSDLSVLSVAWSAFGSSTIKVQVARSTDGGQTWGAADTLNPAGPSGTYPLISMDGSGDHTSVGWSAWVGSVYSAQLVARDFGSEAAWASPTSVPGQLEAMLASRTGSRYVATIVRDNSIVSVSVKDGSATWATRDVAAGSSSAHRPRAAGSDDLSTIAVSWMWWSSPASIRWSRSSDAGATWSAETEILGGGATKPGAIAASSDGSRFAVVGGLWGADMPYVRARARQYAGYTLTFAANGAYYGSVPNPLAALPSWPVTVPGNTGSLMSLAGNFGGWNSKADGSGATYKPGDSMTLSQDDTVYALWLAVPDAPSAPTASVSGSTVTLTWGAPLSHGSPITAYTVWQGTAPDSFSSVSSGTCTAPPISETPSCTVTGLSPGTYYFRVAASNAEGSGDPSTATAATVAPPASKPAAPAAPAAAATLGAGGSLTINWSAPAANGATIDAYGVLYGTGLTVGTAVAPTKGTCTAPPATSPLTCTITGLYSANTYYVWIRAHNSVGWSDWSSASSGAQTTSTVPASPSAPNGWSDSGMVTLEWAEPADNGTYITGYTVQQSSSPSGTFTNVAAGTCTSPPLGSTPSCTVTGLTNGSTYYFRLQARNAVGAGPFSPSSTGLTPAGVPGAPGTPTGTGGVNLINVSWGAAAPNGSAVAEYVVEVSTSASSGFTTASTGTCANSVQAPSLSCYISGLSEGTVYYVRVKAHNGPGDGPYSAVSAGISPWGPPSAPAAPSVTATSGAAGSLTATWAQPATNGYPIDAYDLRVGTSQLVTDPSTVSPSSGTCTAPPASGTLSCTITGLYAANTYYVWVRARNSRGWGTWSPMSLAAAPTAVAPSAPSAPTPTAGNGVVDLTWQRPAENGAAITSYTVQATTTPGTARSWTAVSGTCAQATWPYQQTVTCQVTGLLNGTTYFYRVLARNAVGASPYSPSSPGVTPAGPPLAPAAPTGVGGQGQISLSWTPPSGNGSPITGYVIEHSTLASGPFAAVLSGTCVTPPLSGTLSCTITNLAPSMTYYARIRAVNAFGPSPWSPVSTAISTFGIPSTPAAPTGTPGVGMLTVAWTTPAANGFPIDSFEVRVGNSASVDGSSTSAPESGTCSQPIPGTSTNCTITGLYAANTYFLWVRAHNAQGWSSWSPTSAGAKPTSALPSAVTSLVGTPQNTMVNLQWNWPTENGAPVTAFLVSRATSLTGTYSPVTTGTCAQGSWVQVPTVYCDVTGLTNATTYYFRVAAINSVGTGPNATSAAIAPGPPPSPAAPVAQAGSTKVVLTWAEPVLSGSAPVIGYVLQQATASTQPQWNDVTSSGCSGQLDADRLYCTITGLSNGTALVFRFAAVNSVGTGPWSLASAAVTPTTVAVPEPLAGLTMSNLTTTSATVSWAPLATTPTRYEYVLKANSTASWPTKWTSVSLNTSASLTKLATKTRYVVRVRAVNAAGVGPYIQVPFTTL